MCEASTQLAKFGGQDQVVVRCDEVNGIIFAGENMRLAKSVGHVSVAKPIRLCRRIEFEFAQIVFASLLVCSDARVLRQGYSFP